MAATPLSILQVLPALESGGVERGTVEMAQAITAAGGRAFVASAGGRMVGQVERAGARHFTLPLMTKDPVSIWLNAWPLARLIREQQVTLVHARSRAPAWSAYWAARRTRVPFITTWHGVYSENFPGKRLYNSVMAKGERVIAISGFVRARLLGLGVPEARIRLIPRGVDAALFDPAGITGERMHKLSQAWRLPPDAPVIMLPGRLTGWKGAELLLQAAARMKRQDFYCVLVGGGSPRLSQTLIDQAEQLGLAQRLRLAGHCDDMPAALMLADLVVCPSTKPEPFGRTVIEAQAMARPVIAADHGGAVETIADGDTGWRVKPGDAGALAEVMEFALNLPAEHRAILGQTARAAVLEHYTTQAMQAATLAVYREVLG